MTPSLDISMIKLREYIKPKVALTEKSVTSFRNCAISALSSSSVDTNSSMVGVDSPMVERAVRVGQMPGRAAQPRQVVA